MKKQVKTIIGLAFIFIGIFIMSILTRITGATINTSINSSELSFFIGISFIAIGFLIFTFGKNERLEDITEQESQGLSNKESILASRQKSYVEVHTPDYLKENIDPKTGRYNPSWIYKLYRLFGKATTRGIYGKENLPEGPVLFIANHRAVTGEMENLIAALDKPVHIFAAETINWNPASRHWFAKGMGMIPIKETLSNSTPEEKQEALKYSLPGEKKNFQKVIDKENIGNARNVRYIRSMVSMLMQGDYGAVMAEGPSFHLTKKNKRSYAGYALVAREYERQTGRRIPIVPVGLYRGRVAFGESFYVDKKARQTRKELEDTASERINRQYNLARSARGTLGNIYDYLRSYVSQKK